MFPLFATVIRQVSAHERGAAKSVLSSRRGLGHRVGEGREPQFLAALNVQNRYPSPLAGSGPYPGQTPHFSLPRYPLARLSMTRYGDVTVRGACGARGACDV